MPHSPRIEIRFHPVAARAFAEVRLAAILAAQKPLGEAKIGDDADVLGHAQIMQRSIEGRTVVEIVFRLQHRIARQVSKACDIQRGAQLAGIEVGGADVADLALGE